MIAVIFEVWPAVDGREPYLAIAAELRPLLDGIDGFVSIERFASLSEPGKVLSVSYWRDEEAVAAWRRLGEHRAAQAAGRGGLFADYRLRIAGVIRDYGMTTREEAPGDSRVVHDRVGEEEEWSPEPSAGGGRARGRGNRPGAPLVPRGNGAGA